MTNPCITHHLTSDLLMAYSAGTLPEAFSLLIATHITLCDDCRAEVESLDALGGALIEDHCDSAADMADDALDAALLRISQNDPTVQSPPCTRNALIPEPLRHYVGGGERHIKWRPVGLGVKQARLRTAAGASARLLYIPAGRAMPEHGHNGVEMTMVLQGAFFDEQTRFARGDVEIAGQETHHTPIADLGEDCICFAVADANLRFQNLLPRIAQPFLRI